MVKKTLLGKMFSLLESDQTGAATNNAAASQDEVQPEERSQNARLDERIKEVLAKHPTAVGGRVNLLNLANLADRYGPRWPVLAERIDQLIRMTLSQRLSPRDVFSRAGDGIYVLILDGLSESEAKLKCAMLADEIAAKLFGSAAMDAIDVCSAAAEVDGSIVLKSVNAADALEEVLSTAEQYSARKTSHRDVERQPSLPTAADIASLVGAVEQGLAAHAPSSALPSAEDVAADASSNRLAGLLSMLRQTEAALMKRIPQGPGPQSPPQAFPSPEEGGPDAAHERSGRMPENHAVALLSSIRGLIERVETALKTESVGLTRRSMSEDELMAADLTFLYRPMWFVPRGVINAHVCQPAARLGRQYAVGDALLPEGADSRLTALLDRVVLRKAVEDVHGLLQGGGKGVLIVPVHRSTLTGSRASREYLAVCRAIDPDLVRYLVWEILEPASSLSSSQLAPAVIALKALGRGVLIRTDLDHARFEDFFGIGIYSVGTDVGDLTLSEADLIRKLELFRARACRYDLRCHVHGLRSTSLLAAAVCTGFDYVDGDGVAPSVAHPASIAPFNLDDLYSRLYPEIQATA